MLNPNTQDSPSIKIRFKDYGSGPVTFPNLEVVLEVASKEIDLNSVRGVSVSVSLTGLL